MRFSQFHRNIKIRIIMFFVTTLVGYMILPFMAIYFSQYFGASRAGVLLGLEVIIATIAAFYGGYFSDLIGRKKIMVIAELIRVISFFGVVIWNSPMFHSPSLTFVFLTIASAAIGLSAPAAQAMIIDVSNEGNRKFIYSLQYWSMNGAMAIGGILGSLLFNHHRFLLFFIVFFISLINLFVLYFFVTETFKGSVKKQEDAQIRMYKNYRAVANDTKFLMMTLATLLALSIEFQLRNYLSVRLAAEFKNQSLFHILNYHVSINGIELFGVLNAENAIIIVSCGYLVSKLMKRLKDVHSLYFGILFNALPFGIMAFISNPWILLIMMMVASISELMYWPIAQSTLSNLPPENSRSSYMAIVSLVPRGAMLLGSLAISLGAFIPSWMMGLTFFFTGLLSISLFVHGRRRNFSTSTLNIKNQA